MLANGYLWGEIDQGRHPPLHDSALQDIPCWIKKQSLACNRLTGPVIVLVSREMNTTRSLLFVLVATCVTITQTQAAIVLDTTANESATLIVPASSGSLSSVAKGWSFTVVGAPWTITDVSWGLYANSSGTADMRVRLYNGIGVSGTLLESTGSNTVTLNPIASAQYYDWTGLSWNLTAGTYTIAAYYAGGTVTPRIAATSQTMVADPSWSIIGPTEASNNYALLVQASIPEPSTFGLALGGLVLGVLNRRRVK